MSGRSSKPATRPSWRKCSSSVSRRRATCWKSSALGYEGAQHQADVGAHQHAGANQPEERERDVAVLRSPCTQSPFCASTPKIHKLPEYIPSPKGHSGRSGGGLVPPWTYPIPIELPERAIFDQRSLYNSAPPRGTSGERVAESREMGGSWDAAAAVFHWLVRCLMKDLASSK